MERCAAAQLWLFETIFLDEIEQNQAILLKSYNVHHFINLLFIELLY